MVKFAIGRAIAASSASWRKGCREAGRAVEMHARRLGGDADGVGRLEHGDTCLRVVETPAKDCETSVRESQWV